MSLHAALTFNGMRAVQQNYGLTPFQFAAYMAIALSADGRTGATPPISYPELGKRAGMARRSAFDSVQALRKAGLIAIESGKEDKDRNRYSLLTGSAANALPPDDDGEKVVQQMHGGSAPDALPAAEVVQDLHSGSAADALNKDIQALTTTGDSVQDNNPSAVVVVVEPEIDSEDGIVDQKQAEATVWSLYTDVFGDLSEFMGQKLGDLRDKYSEPWLRAALIEAGYANADSFNYVTTILENWRRQGYASPKNSVIEGQSPGAKSDLEAVFFDNPAEPKNDFRLRESGDEPQFIPPPDIDDEPKNNFRVVHEAPRAPAVDADVIVFTAQPTELKAVGD